MIDAPDSSAGAQPKRKARRKELDAVGIEAVCDRIEAGENLRAIAKSLGMAVAPLWRWLHGDKERSARAREAMQRSALAFDEMAEEVIKGARNILALSRARELAQHYRWRAAKRNPAEFSERMKQIVSGPDDKPLEIRAVIVPAKNG